VPMTPYAASKAACDHIVHSYRETYGIDAAIVRPFNNFGPARIRELRGIIPIVVRRVMENSPIEVFGDGEQTRDFVFVRDTAEAMVRIYGEPKARGKSSISPRTGDLGQRLDRTADAVLGKPNHPVIHSPRGPATCGVTAAR